MTNNTSIIIIPSAKFDFTAQPGALGVFDPNGSNINAGSPSDNDLIGVWFNDVDGINNGVQINPSNNPKWRDSGFGVNNMPYLEFSTNDYLDLGTYFSKLPNHTVYVVVQFDNISLRRTVIAEMSSSGAANSTGISVKRHESGVWLNQFGDNTNHRQVISSEPTGLNEVVFSSSYSSGDSLTAMEANGSGLTESTLNGTATYISGTKFKMSIGRTGDFSGQYMEGKIGHILIYNQVHTPTVRLNITNALKNVYGIS